MGSSLDAVLELDQKSPLFVQNKPGTFLNSNTPSFTEGAERRRLTPKDLQKRFHLDEFLAEKIITGVSFVSLATIVLIFIFVFREALPILFPSPVPVVQASTEEVETYGEENLGPESAAMAQGKDRSMRSETSGAEGKITASNLMSTSWQPVSAAPHYGIWPLLLGSFKVTFISICIAAPLAILAAMFTSSFAPRWAKETLKPAIEILAGFPSVVIGFFALVVLASVLQDLFGYQYRLNTFVGGVAMSLAVIPIIYTVADDALSAVPAYLTEASLALGATKWQTAFLVTLPAAIPGVFASIVLGFGRAFGETMIVLMATGNASLMSVNPFDSVRTMSATIGAEMAEVVFGDTHYTVLFFLGALLFVLTFVLNAGAEFFVRDRLLKRFRGN
jgi:phosphate transport system permease protein